MSNLSIFSFSENSPVRVSMVDNEPWFSARDVACCLEYTNSSIKSLPHLIAAVPEQWKRSVKFETNGGAQNLLALSEQGLYFFVCRSDKPKALPFQMWLAGEVLPSIRKTGKYELPRDTITVEEQYYIRKAVAYNAKRTGRHYRDVYNGLYNEFQIPRYKELKREDYKKALEFLDSNFSEQKPVPAGAVVLNESEAKLLLTFIYVARYLFRGCFALTYQFLEQSRSPMTGIFYEFLKDPHLAVVEKILDDHGYSMSDLECYKHYVAQGYNH